MFPSNGHFVSHFTAASGGSNTLIVALVAGAAAIVASLFTGWIVTRNTRSTIAAERAHLNATLDAEDRRLETRLSFERGEADRRELRNILDALADDLAEAESAASAVFAVMRNAVSEPSIDLDLDGYTSLLRDGPQRIDAAVASARKNQERLKLRLGSEGDRLARLADHIQTHAIRIRFATWMLPADQIGQAITSFGEVQKKRREFTTTALKFTEARLYQPSPPEVVSASQSGAEETP